MDGIWGDVYLISTPSYEKVTIHLENGKDFVIIAKNVNDKNIYIQEAKFNGEKLERNWFRHTEIKNGGTLEFLMGNKPSGWGTKGGFPPSMSSK